MKKDFSGIYSYQEALDFLKAANCQTVVLDKDCYLFQATDNSIYVVLNGLDIVKFNPDGTIIIHNNSTYTARMKRYLSYFVKEKIKQKEFQWYLGEQIFFSTMIFQNGQWRKS